jgi:hypothetical protein
MTPERFKERISMIALAPKDAPIWIQSVEELKDALVEEPLPCPWCGTNGVTLKADYGSGSEFMVRCANDGCVPFPSTKFFDTEEEAIAAWNKRK